MKRSTDILDYEYTGATWFPVPEFPLAVVRVRHAGDVPRHTHDFVEIVYVAAGRALHRREAGNLPRGRASTDEAIGAGDVFVVPLGGRHAYRRSEKLEIYNVTFQPDLLRDDFAHLRKLDALVDFFLADPMFGAERGGRHRLSLPFAARAGAVAALDIIVRELAERRPGFEAASKAALLDFLVRIGRACAERAADPDAAADLAGKRDAIRRAMAFMEENFASPLALEDIAHHAFLSAHYFSDLFKTKTGVAPWDYLTGVRLERARRLLLETNRTVTDIAYDVGFGDASYFTRVFRAREGVTPRAFRKSAPGRRTH